MHRVVNVMTIHLYKTNDDTRKAWKSLTALTGENGIEAVPTTGMSKLSPVLILAYNSSYLEANYCYIPLFDRYYTIGTPDIDIGEKIVIPCSVDAVMSAYSSLGGQSINAVRSQSAGINIIPDSKLPILPNVKEVTSTILTSSLFDKSDTNSYLLAVIGDD